MRGHPDYAIVVDSPNISRFHLIRERQAQGYRLQVMSSTDGTWLGPRRVSVLELLGPTELRIGSGADKPVTLIYRPALAAG